MKKCLMLLIILLLACGCANNFGKQRRISGPSYQIAVEKLNQNDTQAALVELKKGLKANPEDPEIYYGFAVTFMQLDKLDEAIQNADKAIEFGDKLELEHPGMKSEAYNLKGTLLMMQKKYDEALKCFKLAIDDDLYKTPEKSLYNMAVIYIVKGNYSEAKKCLEDAISKSQNDAPTWDALGVVYSRLGDSTSAINALLNALKIDPDFVQAHWDIAQVYIDAGNLEEAKKQLLEVVRLDSTGGFAIRATDKLKELSATQ